MIDSEVAPPAASEWHAHRCWQAILEINEEKVFCSGQEIRCRGDRSSQGPVTNIGDRGTR